MFDFILRWFGKGKPQEDASSQGGDTSFLGSNSLFANEEGDEATSTSIEEAERADAAELCGQADNTLRTQIAELTARLAKAQKALKNAEEENEELEEELKRDLKREAEKTKEAKEQVRTLEKDLSSLKEALDETNKRANCRGEALTFVREVLTAQVNSERSELEQKVEEMVALQATRLPLRLLQTAVKLFDTLILSLESLTQSLDLFRSHFLCFGRRRTYAIAWLCREDLILENSTSD